MPVLADTHHRDDDTDDEQGEDGRDGGDNSYLVVGGTLGCVLRARLTGVVVCAHTCGLTIRAHVTSAVMLALVQVLWQCALVSQLHCNKYTWINLRLLINDILIDYFASLAAFGAIHVIQTRIDF